MQDDLAALWADGDRHTRDVPLQERGHVRVAILDRDSSRLVSCLDVYCRLCFTIMAA